MTRRAKKKVDQVRGFLKSSIGGEFEIPHEYTEYKMCKLFGCLPHQLDDMPEETLRLFTDFMRLEEETGMMQGHG